MQLTLLSLLMFSCYCIRLSVLAAATSTLSMGQSFTSSDTLVSSGGVFELGFFSPGNPSHTYLGIWYKKIKERTIVWVGNRDPAVTTSSPALSIDGANLVILDGRKTYRAAHLAETSKHWSLSWRQPRQACEVYKSCGSFSICGGYPFASCECLDGFRPSDPKKWQQNDTSAGCVRKIQLQCEQMGHGNGDKDGFLKMDHVRLPHDPISSDRTSAETCESACSDSCSCTAYTNSGTSGCALWHGDLFDLNKVAGDESGGETIFIKLAAYELQNKMLHNSRGNNKTLKIALASVVPPAALVLTTYICCQWKKKQKGKMGLTQDILVFDVDMSIAPSTDETSQKGIGNEKKMTDAWLPLFSFSSVTAATENFSSLNKLGEGGFGPVYKGKLLNGKHVAVKRLSKKSAQGMLELKNETMLIAKLQHKNLVRLLGCCLDRDEKILIYEYMPNKSLDSFLFDQTKGHLLSWETRLHIVEGIAQGLIYLHQHSRLRIVHRDLKASNILLDSDMNPKISDFGLAKMFGGNESVANTNQIVGTYGYISAEYALEGVVSTKSDVFSFGVLLLEIISGKKNTGFYQTDSMNLLGYAWQLWQEDRVLCLVDSVLDPHKSEGTLIRHINVAPLCVQEIAADRPTMSQVLTMLAHE
ncbi:uncharacterized protein J3R85_009348 [Psidium guajava]|nr:uncharacterized protein J3R85_009348 [Psidium guajava]